jgi:hypothetical protein
MENLIDEICALIEKLELKSEDFEKRDRTPGVKAPAHDKVVNAIRDFWEGKYPFIQEYSAHGIDYVGRKLSQGPIELAVEVDEGWWRARDSVMKLADIRANLKVWINISNKENSEKDFDRALKDIQTILKIRNETKETFGNFLVFLKTPNPKDFKKIRIF